MNKEIKIKFIRFLMYVGGFFVLFFLLTMLLWGILLSLPPIPGCGGFACLDIGFAIVIGSLFVSVSVSFSVILGLYWRWEVQGKWVKKAQHNLDDFPHHKGENAEGSQSLPYEDKM